MEIDLYWFDQMDIRGSVTTFWDRFTPLYSGVEGYKGVVLNVGWTVGPIMEWTGNLQQKITLPRGEGEQPWVEENSPLAGDTDNRMREWKRRFAKPPLVQRHGYGAWSYGDLKQLAQMLRDEAAKRGVKGFKVGTLVYAAPDAYGERAQWARRHPEAFTRYSAVRADGSVAEANGFFDPKALLHADSSALGGLAKGIPEGMSVHEAFASQWGNYSLGLGLDALMLRDSFGFPLPYHRGGPEGPVMSSPETIRAATDSVAALVREAKTANPAALIMMYSNAASAIGDWRSNGLDLERVAKEGYLDIFVDQTWAGAWNEVGLRPDQFWNRPTLGWTYQLAYTLLHGAMLANTKVRHYPLIETFDAWESWDVLHTVPQRLRWGIWAYSHASVKTPHGIAMPQGSYISWGNQGKRLLSERDVRFLTTNIGAAVRDAADTREVFGPTLVYSREAMQWQADHATPNADIKEWIDEQAGSVIKWPVPIMSATRLEWLPQIQSDLPILQTPVHLPAEQLDTVLKMIHDGKPLAIFGSFAGGIAAPLLQQAGEGSFKTAEPKSVIHMSRAGSIGGQMAEHVPPQFPVLERLETRVDETQVGSTADMVYATDGIPELILQRRPYSHLMMWNPPDFFDDCCSLRLRDIWGGSAVPYALAAGSINRLLADSGSLHSNTIDVNESGTVAAWSTSDGKLHLLAGNLEEGLRDDGNGNRALTLDLPKAWRAFTWHSAWNAAEFRQQAAGQLRIGLPPNSSLLLSASPR